jgi:EpsI family protein
MSVAISQLAVSPPLVVPGNGPRVAFPWKVEPARSEWRPFTVSPTRVFSESFASGNVRIDRFIALYAGQGHANNLVRSENRDADEKVWTFDSQREAQLNAQGIVFPVRVSSWVRGTERRLVFTFFIVGGQPVSGAGQAKWDQLRAYLGGGRCISAYVAFSILGSDEVAAAAAVANLLASTESLSRYVCGAAMAEQHQSTERGASSKGRIRQG